MDLDSLIGVAISRVPLTDEVQAAARSLSIAEAEVLDRVSLAIAKRFVSGTYSFDEADMGMNNLLGHAVAGDTGALPDLAWRVYLAFDDGEYDHPGEPPELQGAVRTLTRLADIVELDMAPVREDPAWRANHRSRTRVEAAEIADEVTSGNLSPILGARALLQLRPALDITDPDDDFETLVLIESETDALPLGAVRRHWPPEALAIKEPDIQRAERWALTTGGQAFRNVSARFRESA